mgnify:CR=1 FL=1
MEVNEAVQQGDVAIAVNDNGIATIEFSVNLFILKPNLLIVYYSKDGLITAI